jgi:rhodanese-related sulfurtransferase
MVSMSKGELIEIDARTVRDWLNRGEAVLVDVREAAEYAEERIPGTLTFPLSRFEPGRLPGEPGKKTVLTCFIGGRSAEAAEQLFAAGHSTAFQLDGGLFAWKEAGFATEA